MSVTEIIRIFYPFKLGRRAGSPVISTTFASCPDSFLNPDSYRERGGEYAKVNI